MACLPLQKCVCLPARAAQVWFGQLDHVLPHARIELAELDCSETGYCAGMVHGHYHQRPLPSYVHLNFSCQVTERASRSGGVCLTGGWSNGSE
eukprot:363864-Chlamydomonas_euryale.AAC.7